MREIKFRAWVKGNMYYNNTVSIGLKGGIHFLQPDGEWEVDLHKEVTLMQYTGLKDKNGKKIYEGDILDHNYWVVISSDSGTWMLDEANGSSCQCYLHPSCSRLKIIGNIYENPL